MTDCAGDLARLHDRMQADVRDARQAVLHEPDCGATVLDHLMCAVESIAAYLGHLHPTILARCADRADGGENSDPSNATDRRDTPMTGPGDPQAAESHIDTSGHVAGMVLHPTRITHNYPEADPRQPGPIYEAHRANRLQHGAAPPVFVVLVVGTKPDSHAITTREFVAAMAKMGWVPDARLAASIAENEAKAVDVDCDDEQETTEP